MKKIWLPYPLYFLKPFAIGLAGIILLYVYEDLFTSGLAVLLLGYAAWIIFMRIIWAIKKAVTSTLNKSDGKMDKTQFAKFPDKKGRQL